MSLEKTVDIAHILFLRSPEASSVAGPALWAAFDEVQRFYAPQNDWLGVPLSSEAVARVRPSFTTHYVSPEIPSGVPEEAAVRDEKRIESIADEAVAGPALYDHTVLGTLAHDMVDAPGTSVVITDVEILPPREWRYMIWDAAPNGAVISIAPLDPAYWVTHGFDERDRVAAIKARTRAACLTVVGSLLGIGRCRNPRCYMLANVDSVLRLDEMESIGPEHAVDELTGRSFGGASGDPAEPEPIVDGGPPV